MGNFKIKRTTHILEPSCLQCHRQIDLDLVIEVMLTIIKRDWSAGIATIQGTIERGYEHEVSYWKLWMTKQKIL